MQISFEFKENVKKCCFTGYRPSKLPFINDTSSDDYKKFENALFEQIAVIVNEGYLEFYTGMAMGFDIIAAEAVLLFREIYKKAEIKLICVIPFSNQRESFTTEWKERYDKVLEKSDDSIILSDEYFPSCYQKRNEFMVDNCDCVLTWYDGKPGGTRNTINYALKKQRYVFNINKEDSSFAEQTYIEII